MIFPIGDNQVRGGKPPIFSYLFIAINIIVFLFQLGNPIFSAGYSAIPYELIYGVDLIENSSIVIESVQHTILHESGPSPIYLTLFSAMFMHGGWMHLIGNMVFLWVFADNIESTIGNMSFVLFYIMGGLAASFTHIAFNWGSQIPSLGASGAIAACLGAYVVMFPKSKITLLFILFFQKFRITALLFLGFWIAQQLFSGFMSFASDQATGVAWWAHIGGFFFGVASGFLFRSTFKQLPLDFDDYPKNRVRFTR